MKIVKLYPHKNAKFHFGYLGLDINDYIFHSDSLFSCLVINHIRKCGESNIDYFVRNFPKITSLFYGIKSNGKDVLFFPFYLNFKLPEKLKSDRKIRKKIKMVSLGAIKNSSAIKTNNSKSLIYLDNEGDDIKLFYEDVEEKVSIDKTTSLAEEGKLYSVSYIRLENDVFFFFIIDGELSDDLKDSIYMIKNFGIGGEISNGAGQIERIEIEDFDGFNDMNQNSSNYVNLSVVFPSKDDYGKLHSYKLIERKGWVYFDSKRKSNIIGLSEGSLFKGNVKGEIREEKLNEKVIYRFGKAFTIPVVIDDEN
ncbi:MAG: type III-A CRISPR-associated RAMP protein Csm4 [Candidatus Aenigmarchaeota archaeon]|nr:type III-A CRISPR-associated RAMP protein Csm4 [Candidatus Aenigmarchaeota archaeon]